MAAEEPGAAAGAVVVVFADGSDAVLKEALDIKESDGFAALVSPRLAGLAGARPVKPANGLLGGAAAAAAELDAVVLGAAVAPLRPANPENGFEAGTEVNVGAPAAGSNGAPGLKVQYYMHGKGWWANNMIGSRRRYDRLTF